MSHRPWSTRVRDAVREAANAGKTYKSARKRIRKWQRRRGAAMVAGLDVVDDPVLASLLGEIASPVFAAARALKGAATESWKVVVVDEPELHTASAVAESWIVLHSGMLEDTDDAELAGLIAHEVAHLTLSHAADTEAKAAVIDRVLAPISPSRVGRRLRVWAVEAAERGLSRADEAAADLLAIRLAHHAGFDASGLPRLLARLACEYGEPSRSLSSTHPPTRERLDRMEAAIRSESLDGGQAGTSRTDAIRSRLHAIGVGRHPNWWKAPARWSSWLIDRMLNAPGEYPVLFMALLTTVIPLLVLSVILGVLKESGMSRLGIAAVFGLLFFVVESTPRLYRWLGSALPGRRKRLASSEREQT